MTMEEQYNGMTIAALKVEIDRRTEGEAKQDGKAVYNTKTKKADLVAWLLASDARDLAEIVAGQESLKCHHAEPMTWQRRHDTYLRMNNGRWFTKRQERQLNRMTRRELYRKASA